MNDKRACGTCRHHTAIGEKIPAECRGCIVRGECTKWQAAQEEKGAA